MIDREKVIKGLEYCFATANCDGCPYEVECRKVPLKTPETHCPILDDILALLNEQEAVVRCKDCKFRQSRVSRIINGKECNLCEMVKSYKPADWYCADGERR